MADVHNVTPKGDGLVETTMGYYGSELKVLLGLVINMTKSPLEAMGLLLGTIAFINGMAAIPKFREDKQVQHEVIQEITMAASKAVAEKAQELQLKYADAKVVS